jgi:hypothetical protein
MFLCGQNKMNHGFLFTQRNAVKSQQEHFSGIANISLKHFWFRLEYGEKGRFPFLAGLLYILY